MHVVALKSDGSAMKGLRLKPSFSAGQPGEWRELGQGLYSFELTLNQGVSSASATVSLKGRTPARKSFDRSWDIPVRATGAAKLEVSANPSAVVLGKDSGSTLTIKLSDGSTNAKLALRASSGEVTNLTPMGGGRYTARFVTPKLNYPHLSLITVVDQRDPDTLYGSLVLQMVGKTDFPVKAASGSTVIMRIGDREFGPVQATDAGVAKVPVEVTPGTQSATIISITNGQSQEETLDLRVPETKRVALFPVPVGVPSDDRLSVPVRVAVMNPDGRPDIAARVDFTTTAGTVGEARHEGQGIYVADYQPALGNSQMPATLQISVRGTSVQNDSLELNLVPIMPASLSLSAEPERLQSFSEGFKVFGKVLGPDGKGLSSRTLLFNAAGASLDGAVRDLRNGDYQANIRTTGKTAVNLLATVAVPPTGNVANRVVVMPAQTHVANDGSQSTLLTAIAVDRFGYPVPGTPLTLSVAQGDGQAPSTVSTNAHGLGQFFYTSGRTPGLVVIQAQAQGISGSAVLFQGPESMEVPQNLPTQDAAWKNILTPIYVPREGALQEAIALEAVSGGDVSKLTVKAAPAMAAPGGVVTLNIFAMDDAERGVAGKSLELLVSQGSAGTITDLGGGQYQTQLTIPATASGDVKCSVAIADGSAVSFVKIPISAEAAAVTDEGGGWGSTEKEESAWESKDEEQEAAASEEAVTEETATEETPVAQEAFSPSYRAWGAYVLSGYQYQQDSADDGGGPLLEQTMAVGGDAGPNAMPAGFELGFRGHFHENFGLEASFRSTFYSITAEEFQGQTAPDSLLVGQAVALARYPFAMDNSVFSVGARLGLHFDDFIVFTGSVEDNVIEYSGLGMPALVMGAELGLELDAMRLSASLSEGLARFALPYATEFKVSADFELGDYLFGRVGLTSVNRRVRIVGADSGSVLGTIEDSQLLGQVGLGYAF